MWVRVRALTGEGDKERVVARRAPCFCAAKVEDAAGEVLLEGAGYLGSQEPVALLEPLLPLGLQLVVVVVDELIEEALFGLSAAILDEATGVLPSSGGVRGMGVLLMSVR